MKNVIAVVMLFACAMAQAQVMTSADAPVIVVTQEAELAESLGVPGFRDFGMEEALIGLLARSFQAQGFRVLTQVPESCIVVVDELGSREAVPVGKVKNILAVNVHSTGEQQANPDVKGLLAYTLGVGSPEAWKAYVTVTVVQKGHSSRVAYGPFTGQGRAQRISLSSCAFGANSFVERLGVYVGSSLLSRYSNIEAEAFSKACDQLFAAFGKQPQQASPAASKTQQPANRQAVPALTPEQIRRLQQQQAN